MWRREFRMWNKPGCSWGPDAKINLLRAGKQKKWFAVYYQSDNVCGEILKIFRPKNTAEYCDMITQLTLWNYGTCDLCPIVRAEIDLVA